MRNDHIALLFLKAPVRGRIKTRLAEAVGDDAALDLYRNFILDSVSLLETTLHPFRICYYPAAAGDSLSGWLGSRHDYQAQTGQDLGERMQRAFRTIFSEGFCRAILLGSDIPDLPKEIIDQAFDSLATRDVVLGPAADGGYYLIGFTNRSFLPGLFYGIDWGTATVLGATLTALDRASRSVHLLPCWRDIDFPHDLKSLFIRNQATAFSRSNTMAYLRRNRDALVDRTGPC